MNYTNLTPEQAAIQARAETLKEIIEICDKKCEQYRFKFLTLEEIKNEAKAKLDAIKSY